MPEYVNARTEHGERVHSWDKVPLKREMISACGLWSSWWNLGDVGDPVDYKTCLRAMAKSARVTDTDREALETARQEIEKSQALRERIEAEL